MVGFFLEPVIRCRDSGFRISCCGCRILCACCGGCGETRFRGTDWRERVPIPLCQTLALNQVTSTRLCDHMGILPVLIIPSYLALIDVFASIRENVTGSWSFQEVDDDACCKGFEKTKCRCRRKAQHSTNWNCIFDEAGSCISMNR